MRSINLVLVLLTLATGCATLNTLDPVTGLGVTYEGSAEDAVRLLRAMDRAPVELAKQAVEQGLSTHLHLDEDGDVEFTARPVPKVRVVHERSRDRGEEYRTTQPTNGFMPSRLPALATSTFFSTAGTTSAGASEIVSCPDDRDPRTVAEQSACSRKDIDAMDLRLSR